MASQVTSFDPVIPPRGYPYLVAQKGKLHGLREDRRAWEAAYSEAILATYNSIRPYLPSQCRALLDVGSGLGGIDIVLARHYDHAARVWLLDGVEERPFVERHSKPFSDMGVAREYLALNGVRLAGYFAPDLTLTQLESGEVPISTDAFDLVVSFGAWCFHFAPEVYLAFVLSRLAPGGRVIVDVRRDKADWRRTLDRKLRFVDVASSSVKFERLVYERA